MIIEPKDMSREGQKEFEKWKDPKKLAIRFFCEDSNPFAIARPKEIEPFTNTNTYKYINNIKEDQILASAFTTAYVFLNTHYIYSMLLVFHHLKD